jgi:hypothetical protein
VEADFTRVNQRKQSPWIFVVFRIYSLTFGRVPAAALWIKNLIVYLLVRRRRRLPLRLIRQLRFENDGLTVSDRITLLGKLKIHTLRNEAKFSSIHMGSSRYFQYQELETEIPRENNWAEELLNSRLIEIKRFYALK